MIGDDGRAVLGLHGRGEVFDVIFEGQLSLAAGRFQSGQGRSAGGAMCFAGLVREMADRNRTMMSDSAVGNNGHCGYGNSREL
jgi:hypothetical protein